MSLEIIPAGAALGAEIRGVDLGQPLGDNVFAEIEHAYDEYGVIFFRDQRIAPEQQVAFTRRFGAIEFNIFGERWSVPGCPEIVVVSNITEDGKTGRCPPSRRELAQRYVLHGATAARDDPLCNRNAGALWAIARR